jgi:endogenous inhibitor of DNA gyrase (YacG/DUF329 family)
LPTAALADGFVVGYSRIRDETALPICRTATDSTVNSDFPFCSERCRLIDLGAWSSEKYVISQRAFDESMFNDPEHGTKKNEDAKG